MPVFKAALRMIFRNPVYLLVYIVLFGCLGLVLTGATGGSATGPVDFQTAKVNLAVIDRDQSSLSKGLTAYLGSSANLVDLEDTTRTLQDATAQNRVAYILIIPTGYEQDFLTAARTKQDAPALGRVVSVDMMSGVLADARVASYLNAVRVNAIADPGLAAADLVQRAQQVAVEQTPLELIQAPEQINKANLLPFYFKWSSYPLTLGIIALVALSFASFRTGELRRRNLCSPLTTTAMNFQVSLSSLVLILMAWLFICLLSFFPNIGALGLWQTNPLGAALIALSALVYTMVPFAIGFLISQFGLKEMAVNGFAVIISLVFSFLSGIMMGGTDFFSGAMRKLAYIIPSYWYSEAINTVANASSFSTASLAPYFSSLGLMLAFALLFFLVALVVGRLRVQTNTAGGNTAAEVTVG